MQARKLSGCLSQETKDRAKYLHTHAGTLAHTHPSGVFEIKERNKQKHDMWGGGRSGLALLTLSEGLSSGDINRSVPRKKAGSAAAVRVSKRPERPPFVDAQPRPDLHAGTLSPAV